MAGPASQSIGDVVVPHDAGAELVAAHGSEIGGVATGAGRGVGAGETTVVAGLTSSHPGVVVAHIAGTCSAGQSAGGRTGQTHSGV